MTLHEEQLLQVQGSQKGRSASFCIGAEGEAPSGTPPGWSAPPAPRDLAAAARRSQSCRVQGARPRVRRRDKKGEALDLADAASTGCLTQGEPSYHPFLHKAPSCGKVFYQTAEGPVMQTYTPEGSPGAARRARRPPLPSVSTPEDSPSLARRPTRTRALAAGAQGRGSPSSRYKQRALEPDPEDPDAYRLRNFSLTAKGIVNRGDSFRVRRSSVQSGVSVTGASPAPVPAAAAPPSPPQPVSAFSVALLGATGVGKTALIDQFMTSECTNAYDRERTQDGASDEKTVCIELDGEESALKFLNITNPKAEITSANPPDALAIVYSVIDKSSFERAEDELSRLQALDLLRNRCLVLVGNKIDVVRSRAVDESDGMELACSYNAKFIEISVGMNHNCDELLVGILHQLRLKRDSYEPQKEHNWTRNKGIVRASRKVRRTLTRIFGKEDARLRNVTNFRVHN